MFKRSGMLAGAAALILSAGCEKKAPVAQSGANAPVVAAVSPVATHLGFATRVPRDADLFVSGYHGDEVLRDLMAGIPRAGIPELDNGKEEVIRKVMPYVGDEAFLFLGPGVGTQLQMVGKTYRDLSSAWIGVALGTVLDATAGKKSAPDFSKLADGLSDDLLGKWMDALEKDSHLQVPSVVVGWRPGKDKQAECVGRVSKGLEDLFASTAGAAPVSFEASGATLAGFEFSGREIFGEAIAEARKKMAEQSGSGDLLEKLSPERIERLLAAMEKVRFTIASGVVDGHVLIYFGDGKDGFRLAKTPEESIAASDDLKWTHEFADKRITGVAYLSESMVRAALPWLDSSDYWSSLARAIRPPVHEERLLREILTGLADVDRDLAKRDASAWSAVVCEDSGWRFESRGGWPDPSLDYDTPLRMTDAALAANPAIRIQWVQNRERNDLAWKRLEHFGVLIDALIGESKSSGNPMLAMIPEGVLPRLMTEIQGINQAYRDEFRAGIGDEVALVADFQGEVPAFPGISQETVKNGRVPRFVVARPVKDRAKLDASGKSFARNWRSLTAWASELSGENLPLILPQSLESDGLVTWYPPLPFIGGDFIPGVTMNDELWMLGTSKSMAGNFSKYLKTSGTSDDTGMIVEIDFAPIRAWCRDIYQRNKKEAEALGGEASEEMQRLANEENLKHLSSATDRLQGLGYRKWMAGGKPRTSVHLRLSPAR
ncbi:MAG: hypothetical protein ABIS50_25330 [Luteolibacter sp.]|uniref:hypothetical protein n=1 Tax=Luteolibacter sp. TaxID=1962973 RepID=UPI0032637DB1